MGRRQDDMGDPREALSPLTSNQVRRAVPQSLQNLEGINLSPLNPTTTISEPDRALTILRQLAVSLAVLQKATVFYRLLLGRQLMEIQAHEYWRRFERRDYRTDPDGRPVWLSEKDRTYSSWYNFIEEGFERITGLNRQTAYAAMKLATSPILAALPVKDLHNFKRLANALELVATERRGVRITPELIAQAQEMTIESFRKVTHSSGYARNLPTMVAPRRLLNVLKTVAASDASIVNGFWDAVQSALTTGIRGPADTLQELTQIIRAAQ
jgi:hypothetical protein